MKKILYILLPAAAILAACNKNIETPSILQDAEEVTIHVSVPATKISLTPEGDDLLLAWEEGDCLRIISGSESQVYTIQPGFSEHEADFKGPKVNGTTFDILYPGTFADASEAAAAYPGTPVQDGNGDVRHVKYATCLQGVDTYSNIFFTEDWATSHGGSLLRPTVLKLVMTLPEDASEVNLITVGLLGEEFSMELKNVDVSKSDHILTAYMAASLGDSILPANVPVEVKVTGADEAVYGVSFSLKSDTTLKGGEVSIFQFTKGVKEYLFEGGDGTEANPFIIANKRQLVNLMKLYADEDAADEGKKEVKYWAQLTADVNLSGVDWIPFNRTGNYGRAINFDGGGHTISNLTVDGNTYAYPSFAGVVYGDIKDVNFESVVIDGGGNNAGTVGGYIGTGDKVGNCSGITVKNVTISGTGKNVGGFAGVVGSTGTISNCHVTGTNTIIQSSTTTARSAGGFVGNISAACTIKNCTATANVKNESSYYTGGFIGQLGTAVPAVVESCAFLGGNIEAGRDAVKNSPVAGFIARLTNGGATFTDCYVDGAKITAVKSGRVGGFAGDTGGATNSFTSCHVINSTISGAQHCGGFVGVMYSSASKCYVDATTITANDINDGGFAGYPEKATITNCYVTSGVKVVGGACNNVSGFAGIGKVDNNITFCYEAAEISGTGTGVGAFIGYVDAAPTAVSSCIAWHNDLSFYGGVKDEVSVDNITGNYTGTSGTITSQAQSLGWSGDVWNFSGSAPVLK